MCRIASVVLGLVVSCVCLCAQVIENPYVESSSEDTYGGVTISEVIMDEKATYVFLDYITPRGYSDLWVSFSSNTTLAYSLNSLDIKAWGLWTHDDFQVKEFDTRYGLNADRKYEFVLVFPPIPRDVEKISIQENVPSGFYWRGIHLNQRSPEGQEVEKRLDNNSSRSYDGYRPEIPEEHFTPTGSGTCFAINEQGYVATCYHVVEGARKFRVRGIAGDFERRYKATIIATDRENDLAILKIEGDFDGFGNIPYAVSSRLADVGEDIFVLGYPLIPIMGDEIKLTNGLISSRTGYQGDISTYQISATVQPGNSGGPLFDNDGNVIGVVNARLAVESAAYAVKNSLLKNLCEREGIAMTARNTISHLSLAEKIKKINGNVLIIEVE